MNYDEEKGYMIGEEKKGMREMLKMMKEERIGVELKGI